MCIYVCVLVKLANIVTEFYDVILSAELYRES